MRFEPSGYVKDEEAKDWNADALLQTSKTAPTPPTSTAVNWDCLK
ncbi:MAG: DUF2167 domain-containing protein [Zoogloea sp.]|nr:DUF2167 domain-containing protein [Zoogloea sp.]